MTTSIIRKSGRTDHSPVSETGWAAATRRLAGLPGGGLNIAHEAVGRHVFEGHGGQSALIWLGREGQRQSMSYAELDADAARFANVLRAHGIKPGERLFRCCQTDANSSQFAGNGNLLGRQKTAPLCESGGTVQLEDG